MKDVQRIMALGDSHGNIAFMRAALQLAAQNECDAIHVVGDFGIWTHVPAGVRFLDDVDELAQQLDILVTFNDGNHCHFDHLYAIPVSGDGWRRVRPHIWHAPRGFIWRWGGITLMSMGGAHSIDGPGGVWGQSRGPLDSPKTVMSPAIDHRENPHPSGVREQITLPKGYDLGSWWPQEAISDDEVETAISNMVQWVDDYPLHADIDVLFTHDAPSIINLPGISGYPAADDNRARLQKVYEVACPQLLVHGHYHRFNQVHERNMDCLVVGLAHDVSKNGGQYMFIDTDPFTVTVPTW